MHKIYSTFIDSLQEEKDFISQFHPSETDEQRQIRADLNGVSVEQLLEDDSFKLCDFYEDVYMISPDSTGRCLEFNADELIERTPKPEDQCDCISIVDVIRNVIHSLKHRNSETNRLITLVNCSGKVIELRKKDLDILSRSEYERSKLVPDVWKCLNCGRETDQKICGMMAKYLPGANMQYTLFRCAECGKIHAVANCSSEYHREEY